MRKILLVIHDLQGGGAERVFINVANGLHNERVDVEILLARKRGVFLEHLNPEICVHELGAKKMSGYIMKMFSFLESVLILIFCRAATVLQALY